MANVTFSGGKKLQAVFDRAGRGGVKGVDVGVFADAKYQDGTLVAAVAAWNEFGTEDIPERSALRNANKENEKTLLKIIKANVDSKKMVIPPSLAEKLGLNHQSAMQKSIIALKDPPNTPDTIRAKGSTNPLIGKHGLYVKSITYKVDR